MNNRAIIAMSGGVDSSVAAYLTISQGYECVGATMKLFNNEDIGLCREDSCCSFEDTKDAKCVAAKLGMPHYVFNFSDKFESEVIARFIDAYRHGRTPNPCIDCNRYLKFEHLLKRAEELDYDTVVTGHYARIEWDEPRKRFLLKKAVDETKDQSYVLYSMTQDQLAHTKLPLGGLRKTQVREIAKEQGFINADKSESQDICFVQDGDYATFIEQHSDLDNAPGDFIDVHGKKLGTHRGIIHYTIGQRKGLGVAAARPFYVKEIRMLDNTVVLCEQEGLYSKGLSADRINMIATEKLDGPARLQVRTRYHQEEQWATVTQTGADSLDVIFDEPQCAIAPGQAVVLYDGDIVVGGGTIVVSD